MFPFCFGTKYTNIYIYFFLVFFFVSIYLVSLEISKFQNEIIQELFMFKKSLMVYQCFFWLLVILAQLTAFNFLLLVIIVFYFGGGIY